MTVLPPGLWLLAVVAAGMLLLVRALNLSRDHVCLHCGGRGAHRPGCPLRKNEP